MRVTSDGHINWTTVLVGTTLCVGYSLFWVWVLWSWECVLASWNWPDVGDPNWTIRWGLLRASTHIGVILSVSHAVDVFTWLRDFDGPRDLAPPSTF